MSHNTMVEVSRGLPNSPRRGRSHEHSATVLATPRYSASALDRETVVCRLEDHETRASPRKMQKPEVERRVSGQPAQSASEHPLHHGDVDVVRRMHVEAELLDGVRNIRSCQRQVLQGAGDAAEERRVGRADWLPVGDGLLWLGVGRRGDGFAVEHAGVLEDVVDVLA